MMTACSTIMSHFSCFAKLEILQSSSTKLFSCSKKSRTSITPFAIITVDCRLPLYLFLNPIVSSSGAKRESIFLPQWSSSSMSSVHELFMRSDVVWRREYNLCLISISQKDRHCDVTLINAFLTSHNFQSLFASGTAMCLTVLASKWKSDPVMNTYLKD